MDSEIVYPRTDPSGKFSFVPSPPWLSLVSYHDDDYLPPIPTDSSDDDQLPLIRDDESDIYLASVIEDGTLDPTFEPYTDDQASIKEAVASIQSLSVSDSESEVETSERVSVE